VNVIDTIFYELIIGGIALIFLYAAFVIDVNIAAGIFINILCFLLVLLFKSCGFFYISLIIAFVISYRYYIKVKDRLGTRALTSIFVLNITSMCFSLHALFKVIYYYPAKAPLQKYILFFNTALIEAAPVLYIMMSYWLIIIIVLAINNNLIVQSKKNTHPRIIKTTAAAISVVLLIIIINALVFFIIHNYPARQFNGLFDGNFLKDPIKYYYRLPKRFSDCLWFSATTFFTVGYGDMHPVGNIMYLLSMMEMVSAYALAMIMIPILLLQVSK
jgi:hypothetical protein